MSTDLMETFWDAVKLFDKFQIENWPRLEPLLHEHIKMKRLDEPETNIYHEGRQKVHDYMFIRGKDDQAEFKPDKPPDHTEIGDYGFVSGAAAFIGITNREKGGPTDPRRIAYSATFKRGNDPDNRLNWQVIHSWGKYEDKITLLPRNNR
jgi:hypothetical protein